jgi:hypothetical protein
MKLTERSRYRTSMPDSINNHSIRTYETDTGEIVVLDRNNSACPPYFELSRNFSKDFVGITPMKDKDFCEGKSWKHAVARMREVFSLLN